MKYVLRIWDMMCAVTGWLKRRWVLLIVCLCLGLGLYCWNTRPCALCGSQPYNGLCLVDLEKGTVSELTVYDLDALSGSRSSGTFSFLQLCELTGYRDTANNTAGVFISGGERSLCRLYFCDACCARLENDCSVGYMVADMSDPSSPEVYPLIDGAFYLVRCYELSAAADQGGLRITVTGLLK